MTASNTDIRITYLILAHDHPERLQALIDKLEEDPTASIVIHYDRKAPRKEYDQLCRVNAHKPRVYLLPKAKRVACGWGEFSIVRATLNLIQFALALPGQSDYFYLLSGACYPIKPLSELKAYLAEYRGAAFIECEDSSWIQAGMRDDRYKYHHFLNFRKHPWLFRRLYWLQRNLGLKRKLPKGIDEIRFGSQWWCLPYSVIAELSNFVKSHSHISSYFTTVWIADECFFQTIIYNFKCEVNINKSLTYYRFNSLGKPEEIQRLESVPHRSDSFFARKFWVV